LVVTGTSQVASGYTTVEDIVFTPTTVTEQIGTAPVKIGSQYYTMDVTLAQTGYWNGTTQREYFVEGIDYNNSSGANTINWGAYGVAGPVATATFGELTDAQRLAVVYTLGYKPLYDFSYANYKLQKTVDGVTTSNAATWETPTFGSTAQAEPLSPSIA
jgi:hypothetical protein